MNGCDDLKRALDEASIRGGSLQVFFRDDDADDDLPNLRYLRQIFARYAAPVSLAVVPGTLTAKGAKLLRDWKSDSGSLLELDQHGWMHTNHELRGRKCEFGASRPYATQYKDILRGRKRLLEEFGEDWSPVFVPPWNRCNGDTAQALEELGFAVLSRDDSALQESVRGIQEIPVTCDIFDWKGGATLKPAAHITGGLAIQASVGRRTGILLHHKVMHEDAFELLEALLEIFCSAPGVTLCTLQNLGRLSQERITCQV